MTKLKKKHESFTLFSCLKWNFSYVEEFKYWLQYGSDVEVFKYWLQYGSFWEKTPSSKLMYAFLKIFHDTKQFWFFEI